MVLENYQPDQISDDDFLRLETRFFTLLAALRLGAFLLAALRLGAFLLVCFFGFFFWLRSRFIFAPQAFAALDPFFK